MLESRASLACLTSLGCLTSLSLIAGPSANGASQAGAEDLLTFARGVLFVSQTGLASGSASAALLAIDGDPYRMSLTTDADLPVEFVYKLPAATTFERFGVPAVVEQPGNVTFVKSVTVSGSAEGPDAGFLELAAFELETHGPDVSVTELDAHVSVPVRWVKLRFEGGINIEPGDEDRTVIWFSEIIGHGTQEPQELSPAFDGEWDMRLTERTNLRGIPMELTQDGATIFGCYGDFRLSGTVNGAIARATGEDPRGRPGALILVADDDGTLHASVSLNRVRGHTSTEGTEEYNLDLSQRRAQAVVDDFVERGFDPAAASAEGLGESQPLISPDSNESAREINRRVEISCG